MSIGNGNANAVFTKSGTLSDSLMPCLAINYSPKPRAGELPTEQTRTATVQIDANGGAGTSKLLLTVTLENFDEEGSAGTDDTYAISGAAANSDWAGSGSTFTAGALTMKYLVDLLNDIPGVLAYTQHCPHSLTVNTDYWEDLTETDINDQVGKFYSCLYRTIATNVIDTNKEVFFMRVGVPEMRDAGSVRLAKLDVLATGSAHGRIRLYRDDVRNFSDEYSATFATEQANKQMFIDTTFVTATQTAVVAHDQLTALTYQGPMILAVDGSDLTACVASMGMIQASI